MSRKIIGITVGTQLPKPDFNQTNPKMGDFIKNKPDFHGLQNEVSAISALVGDTAVSEQINDAIAEAIADLLANIDIITNEEIDEICGTEIVLAEEAEL